MVSETGPIYQALIEAALTSVIGAVPHQHPERPAQPPGHPGAGLVEVRHWRGGQPCAQDLDELI